LVVNLYFPLSSVLSALSVVSLFSLLPSVLSAFSVVNAPVFA
jgi:hypothetical protein